MSECVWETRLRQTRGRVRPSYRSTLALKYDMFSVPAALRFAVESVWVMSGALPSRVPRSMHHEMRRGQLRTVRL